MKKELVLRDGTRVDVFSSDLHVHTNFSSDVLHITDLTPDALAQRAIGLGLSAIALTDHLDVNSEVEGIFPPLDEEKRNRAVRKTQADYMGRLRVICGIELGQPTQYPDVALEMLDRGNYDFVLGSMHNLTGMPDFALMELCGYDEDGRQAMLSDYLDEYLALTEFPGIDSFAHLTYPLRYFAKNNLPGDLLRFPDKVRKILKNIIARDAALEINSSGYRNGMDCPMPDLPILKLYRDLGGEKVTLGSDAHRIHDVGADFVPAAALLHSTGF